MSDGADRDAPAGRAASATVTVAGLATSRGYAAGPVFVYSKDSVLSVPEYAIAESAVAAELARYRAARAETRRQVEELVAKFKSDTDGLATDVLANHLLLLDDPTADAAVERRISAEHLNAEAAIRHTTDDFRALFAKMKDPYLRERQRDVEDLENRLLRILLDRGESGSAEGRLRVSYTGGTGAHRADRLVCDYLRMRRYGGQKGRVVVVTNDKDFGKEAERLGAEVRRVKELKG